LIAAKRQKTDLRPSSDVEAQPAQHSVPSKRFKDSLVGFRWKHCGTGIMPASIEFGGGRDVGGRPARRRRRSKAAKKRPSSFNSPVTECLFWSVATYGGEGARFQRRY
jgi:hypothetical protein